MPYSSDINGAGPRGPKTSPLRERLFRDAERVRQKDIDELDESLPKKLEGFDLKELEGKLSWLRTMLDRVRLLFTMLRDREFTVAWKTKALIAAGLIYFVLPTDMVPDFIPGIGYIDDALVLGILWKMVSDEVARYRAFRKGIGGATSDDAADSGTAGEDAAPAHDAA